MSSKSSSSSNYTIANLCSVIAICLAIIIFMIQLICKAIPDLASSFSTINNILAKIKEVLLAVAVLSCAFSYAMGMKQNGYRTFVMICCVLFVILFILGMIFI